MVASFLGKVTGLMGPLSLRWCHHLSTGVSNLHEILVFFFSCCHYCLFGSLIAWFLSMNFVDGNVSQCKKVGSACRTVLEQMSLHWDS